MPKINCKNLEKFPRNKIYIDDDCNFHEVEEIIIAQTNCMIPDLEVSFITYGGTNVQQNSNKHK